jgi:hypothetical protein
LKSYIEEFFYRNNEVHTKYELFDNIIKLIGKYYPADATHIDVELKEDNEILLEDDEEVEEEADEEEAECTWSEDVLVDDLIKEVVAIKEVTNQKLVDKLNKLNKLKDDKLENLTDRLSNCSLTPVVKSSLVYEILFIFQFVRKTFVKLRLKPNDIRLLNK